MLRKPEKKLDLYTVLNAGYKYNKNKQEKELMKYNYKLDKNLSNNNEQIYYNSKNKKLLMNVNGTDLYNLKDIATDIALIGGGLKYTPRYKEADNIKKIAIKKYKPDEKNITYVGHSLGGSIVQGLGSKNSNVFNLDSGYTAFQRTKKNQNNYRTSGDLISLLGSNAKHMKKLKNNNLLKFEPFGAHSVSQIKKSNIIIN